MINRQANPPKQSAGPDTTAVPDTRPSSKVPAPVADDDPPLLLQAFNWSEEYGYVTVEGRVTNMMTFSMENVEAVAQLIQVTEFC